MTWPPPTISSRTINSMYVCAEKRVSSKMVVPACAENRTCASRDFAIANQERAGTCDDDLRRTRPVGACARDTIGYEDGFNLYAYVGNDPLKFRDPTGTLRDCDAEYNACMTTCMAVPPPWPWNTGSAKIKKWKHYTYCETVCQASYMACLASNGAER